MNGETITIKPGLTIPRYVTVSGAEISGIPGVKIFAEAEYSQSRRGYEVTDVGMGRQGAYLNSHHFKALRMGEVLEQVFNALPEELRQQAARKPVAEYAQLKSGSDSLLREVAFRVALSRLTARRENAEVCECFEVSQATATRWIAAAEEAGYLERALDEGQA
jgi:hypothetical protein